MGVLGPQAHLLDAPAPRTRGTCGLREGRVEERAMTAAQGVCTREEIRYPITRAGLLVAVVVLLRWPARPKGLEHFGHALHDAALVVRLAPHQNARVGHDETLQEGRSGAPAGGEQKDWPRLTRCSGDGEKAGQLRKPGCDTGRRAYQRFVIAQRGGCAAHRGQEIRQGIHGLYSRKAMPCRASRSASLACRKSIARALN